MRSGETPQEMGESRQERAALDTEMVFSPMKLSGFVPKS
jgi:hypothetical protein